jgi:hypothetical protein
LNRQIQHTVRWLPGKRHWTLPKAFFLLSGPQLGPNTWDLCAAAREGKAQLERLCGISAVPVAVLCRCTLEPTVRIMFLTCGAKGS